VVLVSAGGVEVARTGTCSRQVESRSGAYGSRAAPRPSGATHATRRPCCRIRCRRRGEAHRPSEREAQRKKAVQRFGLNVHEFPSCPLSQPSTAACPVHALCKFFPRRSPVTPTAGARWRRA